ncbi:MAG TPA: hypothetical protein VGH49_19545, partial [Xanthobacteraceae bacterium]
MSELMWITVPGGSVGVGDARQAVLRVLIAPRLTGSALASDGMDHWPPPSLATDTLQVEFAQNGDTVALTVAVNASGFAPQPGLWEAFFGPGTAVTPPVRAAVASPPVVVDATSLKAAAITQTFAKAAAVPIQQNDRSALDTVVRTELMANFSAAPPAAPAPPVIASLPAPPSFAPPDVHRTLSMLREHPAVMRALGLIIELRLPMSDLPANLAQGLVRVRWPAAPASLPAIVSPWSRYDQRFLPAATTDISAGVVTLTDDPPGTDAPRWDVVTVDVDHGDRRLSDAAAMIASGGAPAVGGPGGFMLPALRTAGLMLVRRDRQSVFDARRQAAAANAQLDSMSKAQFTADDLVLGYRLDVKPQGRDWQSLHARNATYTISRNGVAITIGAASAPEEGHLKAHAAVDHGDGAPRTDEVVARWSGWSLAVPQPRFDGPATQPAPALDPGMPFRFAWSFAVPPGTLPRLRFAHAYRLRARIADVAGGGLDVADPAADRCATDIVSYLRYEPVAPPSLTLPPVPAPAAAPPGDPLEQMIIRSDVNAAVTDFPSSARRILNAPMTSLALAEQHGAVDAMTPDQINLMVTGALAAPGAPASAGAVLFRDFAADGVSVFPRPDPGAPPTTSTERAWSDQWPGFKPKDIELRERTATDSAVLAWEAAALITDPGIGDRLVVRLAKAEQLTLELSSLLTEGLVDHFAISAGSPPTAVTDAASQGRHPMVTPARTVTLTHAVRRPLRDPGGTFDALRDEGATFAILDPDPALLGVDPNSTAKLEVEAAWTEPDDNGTRQVANVKLQTVAIDRADQSLKDQLRHEFGDTRHRNVTYTLTAVSRFRQFFDDTDDTKFMARTVLAAPVSVPSSARPSPPVVLSVRPAFVWQEEREGGDAFTTLTRHRLGGRLRLELKGPWFETGEGEQLAVIVAQNAAPPEDLRMFLTQAGLDPTRQTLAPVRFPLAADIAGAGPPLDLFHVESQELVTVVPHAPWFADGRWFVDVVLPAVAASSFWPFVRLAVARYQPNSLPNLGLSPVVMTEMVQLVPDRTLTVR